MADEVTAAENEKNQTALPSAEELMAELEKVKNENASLKDKFGKAMSAQSNASADASKWKKALQERMSEQEREAAETKELIETLKAENAQMKRSQTLAEFTAGYLELGFESALAKKAAEATADGDFSALTSNLKAFITAHDKALQADSLRSTPRPGNGAVAPAVTKEQFDKMKYTERAKLYEEQPELYKELIK